MRAKAAAALLAGLLLVELGYRGWLRARCAMQPADPPGFDLYGVGESTMQGQPWYLAAPPTLVGRALGADARVHNWARGGRSLYPQAYAFADGVMCRDRSRPGAVLVYSGNNDAQHEDSPWWETPRLALEDRSAVMRRVFFLLEREVPAFRLRTLASYRRNLERLVDAGQKAGLTVVLSTVGSNLAIDPAQEAYELFSKGDFAGAREADPGHNFGRAKAAHNDIVRAVARERGALLVEAADYPPALFEDGHHLTLEGLTRLSQAYASALRPGARVEEPKPSKADVVLAMLTTGRWLVSVAARHPHPELRLKLARTKFERALAADPGNRSAKFGLCLVAAGGKGFLKDEANLAWMADRGFFYGEEYDFTQVELEKLRCAF